MTPTIELAIDLLRRASITPEDKGCQELMISRLKPLCFKTKRVNFGKVKNCWLRRGNTAPVLTFAGHTDVVPTGPEKIWDNPPFSPRVDKKGMLLGRGAADMKGSLAAMIIACESFIKEHPDHQGSIAFLITSDEEGPAKYGTVKVIEYLEARNEKIDWCIIGEPSSFREVGDIIKNGRRSSMHGHLVIQGIQGHIAYPHLARNPVHEVASALSELTTEVWDNGNEYFPPTSLQIWQIHAGEASNMIPSKCEINFNFRVSPAVTNEQLQNRVCKILNRYKLTYNILWDTSGQSFLTRPGVLINVVKDAIKEVTGINAGLSTAGGISDGRFIAPTGAQVVELGPVNKTIHQANECVKASDLNDLKKIYQKILRRLLT